VLKRGLNIYFAKADDKLYGTVLEKNKKGFWVSKNFKIILKEALAELWPFARIH